MLYLKYFDPFEHLFLVLQQFSYLSLSGCIKGFDFTLDDTSRWTRQDDTLFVKLL